MKWEAYFIGAQPISPEPNLWIEYIGEWNESPFESCSRNIKRYNNGGYEIPVY
jgi:hypothetical protein